jgi:hypothetical protein
LVFFSDVFSSSSPGCIAPGDQQDGFGYTSPYSGTGVPFIAGFNDLTVTIGDPVAPKTRDFPTSSVPEPSSLAIALIGARALCVFRCASRRGCKTRH